MTKLRHHSSALLNCLLLFAGLLPAADAQVEPDAPAKTPSFTNDIWHVSVSPYLWMAGLDGNLTIAGHEAAVHQSFGDILGNLKFGFMGLGDVRRGHIGLLTDLLYIRIGDQKAIPVAFLPVSVPVDIDSNTFTLMPELGYRVYEDKYLSADALAGFRYYHLGAKIVINPGQTPSLSYSNGNNWADVVVGARIQGRITPKIGAFFIGDAGGGGSSPTWQIVAGIGYKVTPKATAQFGYRHLYFHRNDGNTLKLEATQEGLFLGTTLRLR